MARNAPVRRYRPEHLLRLLVVPDDVGGRPLADLIEVDRAADDRAADAQCRRRARASRRRGRAPSSCPRPRARRSLPSASRRAAAGTLGGACSRSAIVGAISAHGRSAKVGRDRLRPGKLARHDAGKPRRHRRDVPPDLRRRPSAALRHAPRRLVVGAAQPRDEALVRLGERLAQMPIRARWARTCGWFRVRIQGRTSSQSNFEP